MDKSYYKVKVVNKLVLFSMMLACQIAVGQNLLSQKVSIAADSQPLDEILDELSRNSGISFIYNSELVAAHSKTIEATDISVGKLLPQLLGDDFEFLSRGKYVIIQKKQKIKKVTIELQGQFTDAATGKKINEATIYEASNLTSSISNDHGKYNLTFDADTEDAALIISKENYKDTVIQIKELAGKQLDIQLQPIPQPVVPRNSIHNRVMVRLFTSETVRENAKNVGFLDEVPVQVSLVPAVGTNKLLGSAMSNQLSFNIIAGYAYGLKGIELGGVANIIRNEATGVQMAGVSNIVGEEVRGVQLAGATNTNTGDTYGIQMAGGVNVVTGKMTGTQLAGGVNVAKSNRSAQMAGGVNLVLEDSEGIQFAGGVNLAKRSKNALQLAGGVNVSFKEFEGAQLSGALNQAGTTRGAQMAGATNIAGEVSGVQLAGAANAALGIKGFQAAGAVNLSKEMNGLQLAGAMNIATRVNGVQMASAINFATKVKGCQIGIINIADSLHGGVPIGLINIIRKGFIHLELGGNEITPIRLAFKSGTHRLYTSISAGLRPEQELWTAGVGLGTQLPIGDRFYTGFEGNAHWLSPLDKFNDELDLWTQYNLLLGFRFNDNISINFGPSFNAYYSKVVDPETGAIGRLNNKGFNEQTRNGKLSRQWVGWQVGVRF